MAKKKTVIEEPAAMDITNVTAEEIIESMEKVDTTIESNTEIGKLEEKIKEERR